MFVSATRGLKRTHCRKGHEYVEGSFRPVMRGDAVHSFVCLVCKREAWHQDSDRNLDVGLRRLYDIGIDDYRDMLATQDGKCAICGGEPFGRRLDVDHDHESGRVRGLLCSKCNSGIGSLNDDPDLIDKAAAYLRRVRHGDR
jgi:hypothetical protein